MGFLKYVNVKQGSQSVQRFSNGNTLPLTQIPFAMNAFVPQTQKSRGNWFYHPQDRSIEGVRLTHQPSNWIGDYGCFVLSPQTGRVYPDENSGWSGFRPEDAVLMPDYMSIRFLRWRALFELTPTERGAAVRITYDGDEEPRLAVMPAFGETEMRYDAASNRIIGLSRAHSWPIAENFAMYFVIEPDCPVQSFELTDNGQGGRGINVAFASSKVGLKLASSFISEEQAALTLEQELGGRSFDEIRNDAVCRWENYLSRIEIDADEERKKTFYSCLYRMFLFPHKFYENDAAGNKKHYCPHDGSVADGVCYTDNGFWDTCRTVYPMFSLIAPEMYNEILDGYVHMYRDCGWLPKWPSPGEVGMMPGTLIDAVIADAAVKNVVSREVLEGAYEGLMKHATQESADQRYGRHGTADFLKYGYIPRDKYRESVNHTLDYVYGDFCIAQVARVLGHDDIYREYMQRSKNYEKIFDHESGLMRGRDTKGERAPGKFDPAVWGGEYCEGSAWQNSFGVYHDVDGLAALYGGREQMVRKLDELFATPPVYKVGSYGCEIHEMTEMAAADIGQCAISNQPSFHIPFLYAMLGEQKKTDYWVSRIADELFSWKDDGFPGDEDNGSMAGWYVFACLGFYPVCPGKNEYVRCRTLVSGARILGRELKLPEGKSIVSQSDILGR